MTSEEIKSELDTGKFDFLIGLLEDEYLDAKIGKYNISKEGEKQELAKDVSSFANRKGGIIIIGAKTSNEAAYYGRRIEKISTFPLSLINPTDYYNVIRDWIYPLPKDVDIKWVPSIEDQTKGLVYIFVPPQEDHLLPFLITKDIDPSTNRKRKEILFGYVMRLSHASDPFSVQMIHTMLRSGKENRWKEELNTRLAAIEDKLPPAPAALERQDHIDEIVALRVKNALDGSGLTNHRVYCLVISPLQKTEVGTLLISTTESIGKQMEHPPKLRKNGWGLFTGDRARLLNGQSRRAKSDEYSGPDLYRDGTLLFACRADEPFLGFNFGHKQLNPIALVETTYVFFKFYDSVLKELTLPPDEFRVWIQFQNLHQNGLTTMLAPYDVYSHYQRIQQFQYPAPEDNYLAQLSIEAKSFEPGSASFQVLRDVYAWFGIEQDKIPYSFNNIESIDVDKINS